MIPAPMTKKALLTALLVSLVVIVFRFSYDFFDGRTKIVFCDVGQGDATYIRLHNKIDLLVDAGPDKKVLNCLGNNMPFYDRTIELVTISHPQKDHFGGLLHIFNRYKIEKLFMTNRENPSKSFSQLKQILEEKNTSVDFPTRGKKIRILDAELVFLWPPLQLNQLQLGQDDNEFSLVFELKGKNFTILFTGDATPTVLNAIVSTSEVLLKPSRFDTTNKEDRTSKVTVLKVPHHGSKNGLTEKFLRLADPTLSVISVGKNNTYGHPSKEILDILKASGTKIRRTDVEGDIVLRQ